MKKSHLVFCILTLSIFLNFQLVNAQLTKSSKYGSIGIKGGANYSSQIFELGNNNQTSQPKEFLVGNHAGIFIGYYKEGKDQVFGIFTQIEFLYSEEGSISFNRLIDNTQTPIGSYSLINNHSYLRAPLIFGFQFIIFRFFAGVNPGYLLRSSQTFENLTFNSSVSNVNVDDLPIALSALESENVFDVVDYSQSKLLPTTWVLGISVNPTRNFAISFRYGVSEDNIINSGTSTIKSNLDVQKIQNTFYQVSIELGLIPFN